MPNWKIIDCEDIRFPTDASFYWIEDWTETSKLAPSWVLRA
jgi:hypothetical protein